MKILIVEDERYMADVLREGLEEENYSVSTAVDGAGALEMAQNDRFDLILLDIMLPGIDGIEVARRIRREGKATPILMLTARDSVEDHVKGLDVGADDYLTKPFSFEILLARIRALDRRSSDFKPRSLRVADLALDCDTQQVFRGSREIHLTRTEFRLLEFLMRLEDRVGTRQAIIDQIWHGEEGVEENTLDAFVRLLRRKVDRDESVKLIHTRRGFGYYVAAEAGE
jgi:DNA-binding response OmpR family regulator